MWLVVVSTSMFGRKCGDSRSRPLGSQHLACSIDGLRSPPTALPKITPTRDGSVDREPAFARPRAAAATP